MKKEDYCTNANFKLNFTVKIFPKNRLYYCITKNYNTIFATSKSDMVVVAQLVRALDCGSRGRGFKSHHPPKQKTQLTRIQLIGFFILAAAQLIL